MDFGIDFNYFDLKYVNIIKIINFIELNKFVLDEIGYGIFIIGIIAV